MKPIRIALTKGRIERDIIELFESAGIDCTPLKDKKRKLQFQSPNAPYSFILVKGPDVLTYVNQGVADVGIVGSDVLVEDGNPHYEMLDLDIGKCDFCVASTKDYDAEDYRRKIIATKYPNITTAYFQEKGEDVEVIKIEGSVEIAPVLGMADAIVDIVETGATLRENGLSVVEKLFPISTRLIVNKSSLKRNQEVIFGLIDRLEEQLKLKGDK